MVNYFLNGNKANSYQEYKLEEKAKTQGMTQKLFLVPSDHARFRGTEERTGLIGNFLSSSAP